jgi:DNA-binding transcriptional LysR family regulator
MRAAILAGMDERWLRVLVELADHGTLRGAAAATGYSTSAVSQQLATLQRTIGQVLVEPAGRRLALTPAGRALLPHARNVLATLDAARGELAPDGPPVGEVRVAGFASALVRDVVPAVVRLRHEHPGLVVTMQEREPAEVAALLAQDAVDVGLVYDFSLVPRGIAAPPFGEVPMALVVPRGERRSLAELLGDPDTGWITNSRAPDDELVHRVAARFATNARIAHRIDSLDLLVQLVAAGLGVALIAADGPHPDGVHYLDLDAAAGTRRSYALTRPGRRNWHANATLITAVTGVRGDDRDPGPAAVRPAIGC